MCGIAVVIRFDNRSVDTKLFARMRDTLHHRGPDDAGLYVQGPVGLAHRRLSIIDLTDAGHQPMTNEDGTLFIVFNGEIYNYVELREALLRKGHRFRSASDTEVILHQFEEDGEQCVDRLNGMFSFAIWDSRRRKLFAARDRLGIKPLHYYSNERQLVLASEIKAIIEDPEVPRAPDERAVADFFFAGYAQGEKTMFRDIRQVEPGHLLTVDAARGQVRVRKYWDVVYRYRRGVREADLHDELFFLLDNAMKIHCRSDAPLGCHLSGGLDSSTVTAFAARHRKALTTFSIKFSDDDFVDETAYAKAVARHVGAEYRENTPSDLEMATLLPLLIWHMDVPMTTMGAFAYYTVSQLARRHVKVSLTGHGGDELFAGYPAQFLASYDRTDMFELAVDPVRAARQPALRRLVDSLAARGLRGTCRSIRNRFAREAETLEDRWVRLHCSSPPEVNPMFEPSFVRTLAGYSPREGFVRPLRQAATDSALDRCLYHDLRSYLPSLLHFEDRVSMALSLESRVPLLDYRIVEFLATVPVEQKVRGLQPKYLLRQVAAPLLPDEVWQRRQKFNFVVPGKMMVTERMRALAAKILLSPESRGRGIIRPKVLKDGNGDVVLLWMLMNMELWFKIFIDRDPSWTALIRE